MARALPQVYGANAGTTNGPVSAREAWDMLMSGALRVDGTICWVGEDAWRPACEVLLAPLGELVQSKRNGHIYCQRAYAHPWPAQRLTDCVDVMVPARRWTFTRAGQGEGVRVFNVGDELSQRMAGTLFMDLSAIARQVTTPANPAPSVADDGCGGSVELRSVYYFYHDRTSKRKYRDRHEQVVRMLAGGLL